MTQIINLQNTPNPESVATEAVRFNSNGVTLMGTIYKPASLDGAAPAVIVTGAWTTVKEQMPGTYARELAARGFVALAFDFTGWGKSDGNRRYVEDPTVKTADILAATDYMVSRADVDSTKLSGLGICASSGYMAEAVADSPNLSKLALVAPWLHNPEIAEGIYGGAEAVAGLIAASEAAETSGEAAVLTAASTTDNTAPMFEAPYYTEIDRGLIPEYDNKFSVLTWKPWLTYDALTSADRLSKPTLMVGSTGMALPAGADAYEKRMNTQLRKLWFGDDISQFDFYDRADIVTEASDADKAMIVSTSDEAAIVSIVESVGVLADRGEFDALARLYADEFQLDYSSLNGQPAAMKTPLELMGEWSSVLPGFDRTRHALSNARVDATGDKATALADVIASHWIGDAFWQVSGHYDYELAKTEGQWKITSMTFTLEDESGSRDVFGPAIEAAATKVLPGNKKIIAERNKATVVTFFKLLEQENIPAFADLFADDGRQVNPYTGGVFPGGAQGKDALLEYWAPVPDNFDEMRFSISELLATENPNVIFVRYDGELTLKNRTGVYRNKYYSTFQFDPDGKITEYVEIFDPVVAAKGFGLLDKLQKAN
ncbi:Uncharacterized protein YcjY [Durusdinium trenchii]|uniref:Uncharacterized protein YcjY n=1 Tax=Durusdinium trenchii TaxID=1381693 RepID=A0ABP0LMT5_9DINO